MASSFLFFFFFLLLFLPLERVGWKLFGSVWVHCVYVKLTTGKLMRGEEFCLQLKHLFQPFI